MKKIISNLKFIFIFVMAFVLIDNVSAAEFYGNSTNDTEVYFINTTASKDDEMVVIKTMENKYIVYDTGVENYDSVQRLYNRLYNLQHTYPVKIDYLVISHLDSDHYGNAKAIINGANFAVNNLIIKKENLKLGTYNDIVSAARYNGIRVIETSTLAEGSGIRLGSYTTMNLYNVKDVYVNHASSCTTDGYFNTYSDSSLKRGYILKYRNQFENKKNTAIYNYNGTNKYFYYNRQSNSLFVTSNPTTSENKFYGYVYGNTIPACRSNANSIALLFDVATQAGHKYMYFTGDLDNNGYPITGKYYSSIGKTIYGTGTTYFYKDSRFLYNGSNLASYNSNMKNVLVPSEYNVAKRIHNRLGSGVNNIILYQMSHHGQNNSQEAMEELNLNRSSVYAVAPASKRPSRYDTYLDQYKAYYVSLANTKKYYVGEYNGNGVVCKITYNGQTSCSNY